MSEHDSKWQFMDDDEVSDHRSSKGGAQDKIFVTSLRADTPQVFYFLTLPGEDPSDWVNYRELNTREGLRVGPDLPTDLSFGVMVQDYQWVKNEVTGRREFQYDNNLDPITAGEPNKQLWQVGSRNTDSAGLVRVQWRCGVNVVDAITGYHKVLKISLTAKDDLKKYFAVKNEDGDFDIQGRPYEILYTGEGFKWNLAIRPVRPGSAVIRDGKSVEIPVKVDLPREGIDVRQLLIEQREELDAWLASLPTRSGQSVDTSTAPDFVQEGWGKDDTTDLPGGLDLFSGEAKDQALTEKYLAMSPARLRAMHAKAGHDVKRGITKEELAASAAELNL